MSTLHKIQEILNEFSESKLASYNTKRLASSNNGLNLKNRIYKSDKKKKLYEYDLNGNFIKEFDCMLAFCKFYNLDKKTLSSARVLKNKINYGKILKFEKYDKLPNDILEYHLTIKFYDKKIGGLSELKRNFDEKS
jgi:hypothetical protein